MLVLSEMVLSELIFSMLVCPMIIFSMLTGVNTGSGAFFSTEEVVSVTSLSVFAFELRDVAPSLEETPGLE